VSRPHLLDANVVIAAVDEEHVFHARVARWLPTTAGAQAMCPVVEGALVRHLIRIGRPVAQARAVIEDLFAVQRVRFWPDDLSYRDVDLRKVYGHRQVTDTYLVALAAAHGGVLATLDDALVRAHPAGTVLIPELR
jgi:uncharacterized protein